MSPPHAQRATLFGHPAGLYTLFFAEMWERFSYYGMRALLVFYMIKGFLGYGDREAYAVYGAYTALVYMTPFFGGMLADRLLGARRAVVLGGLLMAAGHLLMTVQQRDRVLHARSRCSSPATASSSRTSRRIVGSLYPPRTAPSATAASRSSTWASTSALRCRRCCAATSARPTAGTTASAWRRIGMLTGLAVFVAPDARDAGRSSAARRCSAPRRARRVPARTTRYSFAVNVFVAVALLAAAGVACVALEPRRAARRSRRAARSRDSCAQPRRSARCARSGAVYAGTLLSFPMLRAARVGLLAASRGRRPLVLLSERHDLRAARRAAALGEVFGARGRRDQQARRADAVRHRRARPRVTSAASSCGSRRCPRERLLVVLILTFFSMLFWSFFEQAGSSVNNFTDRNVDRVLQNAGRHARPTSARPSQLMPTQEQLGYTNGAQHVHARATSTRCAPSTGTSRTSTIDWTVAPRQRRHGHRDRAATRSRRACSSRRTRSSSCSSAWCSRRSGRWLGKRGLEPSTPFKFALGLLQLGLGFGALLVRRASVATRAAWSRRSLAPARLPAADDRRAVRIASRPEHGHAAFARAAREHDDGHLVPGHCVLAVPGGDHLAVHRRRRRQRAVSRPCRFRRRPCTSTATCSARSPWPRSCRPRYASYSCRC